MELGQDIKAQILDAMRAQRANFASDKKHATILDIAPSVYAELKKGNIERQLSDAKWIALARRLGVSLRKENSWVAVETETYAYITKQLSLCQENSLSGLLCDMPNIGKTFSAMLYAKSHKNVVYIDCSQVKTKRRLIGAISQALGLTPKRNYYEMYDHLTAGLKELTNPLIILDEVGDLKQEAFLEIKALWNALNNPHPSCGFYLMGADGLRAKIERGLSHETLGYSEIFSRTGHKYNRVADKTASERELFILKQAMQVAQANAPEGVDYKALARRAGGLRRVYTEVMKERSRLLSGESA